MEASPLLPAVLCLNIGLGKEMQLLPRVLLITAKFINVLCCEKMQLCAKIPCFQRAEVPWGCVCVLAAKELMQLERCSGGGVPCTREMCFHRQAEAPLLPNLPSKRLASPRQLQSPAGAGHRMGTWEGWGRGMHRGPSGMGERWLPLSAWTGCLHPGCFHPAGWSEWEGDGLGMNGVGMG